MRRIDYLMGVSLFLLCVMGIPAGAEEPTPTSLLFSLEKHADGKPVKSLQAHHGEKPGDGLKMAGVSASLNDVSKEELTSAVEKVLQDRPNLILAALEKNPVALAELAERAIHLRQARAEEEQWRMELNNPKVPEISADRPMRGSPQAPVTIVEYSDFECPYCRAALPTLINVARQYEGLVRFVYKHNPLNFHPTAEPAAKYFEAIALQDHEQAWRFHDRVFERQEDLAQGVETLKEIAAALDIDHERLEKDLNSRTVEQRLEADRAEAERFDFDGTPAFVINGISLIGNQPQEDFEKIIDFVRPDTQEKTHE